MVDIIIGIILLILSYLIGSIPFGLVLSKKKGTDIRSSGSGNIGTTNAFRVLGKKMGILVGFLDIFKATVIVLVVYLLEYLGVFHNPFVIKGDSLYVLYAGMAVLGHCFPIFLKFKGGKAVATSCGSLLVCVPKVFCVSIPMFALVFILTGYVSLGSIAAALSAMVVTWFFYPNNPFTSIIICLIALLLILRHHKNIVRLINGTESNFKKKKTLQKEAEDNNESGN